METFTIRKAKPEDVGQIFGLIKELGAWNTEHGSQNMENQVENMTPEILLADGFSSNPSYYCFVASSRNKQKETLVGYALYYHSYSTWNGVSVFLEDIYVQPAYRGHSIGKRLFLKVAEVAHKMTSKRLDLHMSARNPAKEFYKSLGCVNLTELEEWQLLRLSNEPKRTIAQTFCINL